MTDPAVEASAFYLEDGKLLLFKGSSRATECVLYVSSALGGVQLVELDGPFISELAPDDLSKQGREAGYRMPFAPFGLSTTPFLLADKN